MAKKSKTIKPKQKPKGRKATAARAALEPDQMIAQSDFLSLLRQVKNRQREMDEARGSMGNAVKLAADRKYLDKVAFSIFRRLDRMSDAKLAVTTRHLLHYMDIGGIEDRATRQLDAMDKIDPVAAKPKRERKKKEPKATPEPEPVTEQPPLIGQMDLSERPDLPLN